MKGRWDPNFENQAYTKRRPDPNKNSSLCIENFSKVKNKDSHVALISPSLCIFTSNSVFLHKIKTFFLRKIKLIKDFFEFKCANEDPTAIIANIIGCV